MKDLNIQLVPQFSGLTEYWKDIPGYEGFYQVSNLGNIKGLNRCVRRSNGRLSPIVGKPMKPTTTNWGYHRIMLTNNKKVRKGVRVHRAVALAFIPNPENKPEVNHINGLKTDNRLTNLEWNTAKENNQHAEETGLSFHHKGGDNPTAKLSNQDAIEIKRLLVEYNLTGKQIAQRYNVLPSAISNLKHGRTWKHLYRLPYIFYCSSWKNLLKYYNHKR